MGEEPPPDTMMGDAVEAANGIYEDLPKALKPFNKKKFTTFKWFLTRKIKGEGDSESSFKQKVEKSTMLLQ